MQHRTDTTATHLLKLERCKDRQFFLNYLNKSAKSCLCLDFLIYLQHYKPNLKRMKQVLLVLFALLPCYSLAQNFQNDGEKYEVYCDVEYFIAAVKNHVHITINKTKYDIISNNGEIIKIKEVTEALNLLSKRGWKLITSSQSQTGSGGAIILHYTMKKDVVDDSEIEVGIEKQK